MLKERANHKKKCGNADAGIRHIEDGPRIRRPDVQVHQQEVNHVAVKNPIDQIAKDSGNQQSASNRHPAISKSASLGEDKHGNQSNDRKPDEEPIIVLKETEGGSRIVCLNQKEVTRNDDDDVIQTDLSENQPLRCLIKQPQG
jgi:hypothetical protein